MIEFILIRHGETEANLEKRYTGVTDVKLTSNGKKQAHNLNKIISGSNIVAVYSSDLLRCVETADHIGISENIILTNEFREMHFGIAEGLTRDVFYSKHPEVAKSWDDDWLNYKMPGGESFNNVRERVVNQIEKIKSKHKNGNIVIVTHSGCIRILLANYITSDMEGFWRFKPDNASITRLCFEEDFAFLKTYNEK